MPVEGQFEQVLNALYLQKLHYGQYASTLTERALVNFLDSLRECDEALSGYAQDGNRNTFDVLRDQLGQVGQRR